MDVECDEIATPLTAVRVFDVRFTGTARQRIAAWLIVPANASGPLPGLVKYLGYGGGRDSWLGHLIWANAG